jgi:predicted metal-binding membrane protein
MLPGDPQGLRAGASGAFRLGLRLGLFRPGCCWALMPLKFAVAVAVLLWMAALAALPRQACSRFVEVVAPPPV